MIRQDELKVEQKITITEDYYIPGKLLDGTDCKILLDTGAGKSFMSKTFCLNCLSLHSLPKFVSRTKNILVDKGWYQGVLFVIPDVINLHWLRLGIYTLV